MGDDFAISDIKVQIQNLDTIGNPVNFLELTENEPYMLNNTITLGAGDKSFRLYVDFTFGRNVALDRGLLDVEDDNLVAKHLKMSLDVYSLSMVLDGLYRMTEKRFMDLSLGE